MSIRLVDLDVMENRTIDSWIRGNDDVRLVNFMENSALIESLTGWASNCWCCCSRIQWWTYFRNSKCQRIADRRRASGVCDAYSWRSLTSRIRCGAFCQTCTGNNWNSTCSTSTRCQRQTFTIRIRWTQCSLTGTRCRLTWTRRDKSYSADRE